jgi:hypothetical protein
MARIVIKKRDDSRITVESGLASCKVAVYRPFGSVTGGTACAINGLHVARLRIRRDCESNTRQRDGTQEDELPHLIVSRAGFGKHPFYATVPYSSEDIA